ncbi:MAG: hypothetical protein AAFP93_00415 [Bacteroidota bacterium]
MNINKYKQCYLVYASLGYLLQGCINEPAPLPMQTQAEEDTKQKVSGSLVPSLLSGSTIPPNFFPKGAMVEKERGGDVAYGQTRVDVVLAKIDKVKKQLDELEDESAMRLQDKLKHLKSHIELDQGVLNKKLATLSQRQDEEKGAGIRAKALAHELQKELKELSKKVASNSARIEIALEGAYNQAANKLQELRLKQVRSQSGRGREFQGKGQICIYEGIKRERMGNYPAARSAYKDAILEYESANQSLKEALKKTEKIKDKSARTQYTEELEQSITDVDSMLRVLQTYLQQLPDKLLMPASPIPVLKASLEGKKEE